MVEDGRFAGIAEEKGPSSLFHHEMLLDLGRYLSIHAATPLPNRDYSFLVSLVLADGPRCAFGVRVERLLVGEFKAVHPAE